MTAAELGHSLALSETRLHAHQGLDGRVQNLGGHSMVLSAGLGVCPRRHEAQDGC